MHYSLFAGLIGFFMPNGADAVIRVGNQSRTYADAYYQVNMQQAAAEQAYMQQQAAIEDPASQLPVRVANQDVAKMVARGDANAPVAMAQLDQCARIWPNGEMAWDRPTLGQGAGGAQTCVAVVEMRGYQMGPQGQDVVLARANLAAGDAVRCNISDFPEASYTADAGNITFPADNEPTVDDVIRVLNEEQKKNAGLKIAATALVGAVGGNVAGKNEVGKDGLFGVGKKKMTGTAIGALSGAAIGAGNVYAGKVGGDMILSAGVNAAAGSVVGNMAAIGDSVIRIEDCKDLADVKTKCMWGMLVISEPVKLTENTKNSQGKVVSGDVQHAYFNIIDGKTIMLCDKDNKNCKEEELVSVRLSAYPDKELDAVKETDFQAIRTNNDQSLAFHLDKDIDGNLNMKPGPGSADVATYTPISSAGRPTQKISAMITGVKDKAFGMKRSDWGKWMTDNSDAKDRIVGRSGQGDAYKLENIGNYSIQDFYPAYTDSTDGGIIDLGNKARLKSTLIGAGAGGAMGAFVAYQGAQSDIDERWVSAVREYKDSLQKVYCITGDRFLSYYNDMFMIPNMGE